MRYELADMGSGECRWVGRYDIHVYCRNPLLRDGQGWRRGLPSYKVVTEDSDSEYMTIDAAAALVVDLMAR
jgi:hypothetical protein